MDGELTIAQVLSVMEKDLHDLCQPLTLLQGRLEIGKEAESNAELLEAVTAALGDAADSISIVVHMRERLSALRRKVQERRWH
ncbi:MAG: hypothetical protein PW735_01925 [Acidobacteriaceae bacterium]|nr:hypothetical protein [Acidobacteriaceae bacterium]